MTAISYEDSVNPQYLPSEELWLIVEPFLPIVEKMNKSGRRRKSDRQMFFAMFYILCTGIQWKALPKCLGAASTVHDRFSEWVKAGVFKQLWELGLMQLHCENKLDWQYQSIDSCMTKAPLGGESVGPNPTDRAKSGVKRHILTEARGLPIAISVTAANCHDKTEVVNLLETMPFLPPSPDEETPLYFCADKGYDYADVRSLVAGLGYEEHIKCRGQEASLLKIPGYRARRWVCERTHSWMNRFRRLLIRWEKKVSNFEAFLYLASALIVWKKSSIFG